MCMLKLKEKHIKSYAILPAYTSNVEKTQQALIHHDTHQINPNQLQKIISHTTSPKVT